MITGNSPAIIVNGGTVILQGVTAQTATNSPTIVVNSGSLVVRDSTMQESTGYDQAAILITGGTVDLGTAASPGGNTFNVNGTGVFLQDTTSGPVPDIGNTLEINGSPLSSPYLQLHRSPARSGSLVYGQTVTLTAAVRAANPTDGTPTGTVAFVDATTGANLGTATVMDGTPCMHRDAVARGREITADYEGDNNFAFSLGTGTQVVDKASTSTAVATSVSPSVSGQAVTFTATVFVVSPEAQPLAVPLAR